ncbi:hypothetical protein NQZ68_028112 [Dissostichus eleginoides]|nr:hypothetical protein NQZ68_028112 [Dissostichus eleginoides]
MASKDTTATGFVNVSREITEELLLQEMPSRTKPELMAVRGACNPIDLGAAVFTLRLILT